MADNNNFFQSDNAQDDAAADIEQKIHLGDKDYSQDELSQLVGLGEIARETEQKYNVKIDGIWQNFQRTINEKKELETRLQEAEQRKVADKAATGADLTPEERRTQAIAEADSLGLIHSGNIEQRVLGIMQGYQLLNDANGYIADQAEAGNPKTNTADLLNYMNGQNPTGTRYGSIEKAYKDMFETELEQIKEQKLGSLRPERFVTTERSTAGGKQPVLPKPNKDNLEDLVRSAIRGNS